MRDGSDLRYIEQQIEGFCEVTEALFSLALVDRHLAAAAVRMRSAGGEVTPAEVRMLARTRVFRAFLADLRAITAAAL